MHIDKAKVFFFLTEDKAKVTYSKINQTVFHQIKYSASQVVKAFSPKSLALNTT